MPRSLLISIAVHSVLFTVIFLGNWDSAADEQIAETLSIRLKNPAEMAGFNESARAVSPAESPREPRRTARIPSFSGNFPDFLPATQIARPSATYSQRSIADGLSTPAVTAPPPTRITDALDPLAGMEKVLPEGPADTVSGSNPWSLSWVNGTKRGILSFPMIDVNAFPEDTERLLNVQLLLRVSPEGEVVSAEIVPPGSGDIRIDRYMHSIALQLFLEPWPQSEGVQEGRLRLLFLGGRL